MAADALADTIGGKGKVAIISHNAGTSSAIDRIDGFVEQIKKSYPAIQLVAPLYSDGDPQKAMNQTMDTVRANPDLKAIYATNEGSSLGVATAIQSQGLDGKIKVVGFDASDAIVNFVEIGVMQGVIVQDAYQIGYLGIQTLSKVLGGQTVEKVIDVPAVLVNSKNIRSPKIQKVIKPLG